MNHEFWYLSRAAGFTAYLLLFASVALGIATSTRLGKRLLSQNAIFDVHRFVSILALLFTLFHVYILLGDGYFGYSVVELTLPFLSPYRMWSVAAGSFALYTLVFIVLSFYVRQWIGYRAWRMLHFLTFALYAGATVHGITAGTDTSELWGRLIYLGTGAIVASLIAYRLQHRVPRTLFGRRLRLAAAGLTIATAIVLVFGTGLLTKHDAASVSGTANALFLPSFASTVTGTYQQTRDSSSSELVMDGTAAGDLQAKVRIELTTQTAAPKPDAESPSEDAGEDEGAENRPVQTVTRNVVQLSDPGSSATLCTGTLHSLQNGAASMSCDGQGPLSGVQIALQAQFRTSGSGSFSGSISGRMTRSS